MPTALHLRCPRPGRRLALASCLALPTLMVRAGAPGASPTQALLFEGLEGHRHVIESRDPQVRRLFDQAMLLVYGFNPAEAVRSLEAALVLDPTCASAWWALAWALGPNINTDMPAHQGLRVHEALRQARRHAHRAPSVRRELIEALSRRHPSPERIDEEAYAARLRSLVRRHAQDADVALLAAEAELNLHPYDWWDAAGRPQPWTPRIEQLLQRTLRLSPRHPGAHHYWIHLQESSAQPRRGLSSADVLRTAYPGSGHLLHMPSHIDMRVGQYARAIQANERSIAADLRYLEQVDAQGAYRIGYVAHNHHFLWAAASMAGRRQLALAAADAAWPAACGSGARDSTLAIVSHYAALPFFARVRFGLWEELLHGMRPPDAPGPYVLAMWHYARGTALARTVQAPAAQRELQALESLAADPALATLKVKNLNPSAALLRIASLTLRADLALQAGQRAEAVARLREATQVEDELNYDEPHLWLAPTRHALGDALVAAGQLHEAEQVFREDLQHYPDNGWSLAGLANALSTGGRGAAAAALRHQAARAFSDAGHQPSGAHF